MVDIALRQNKAMGTHGDVLTEGDSKGFQRTETNDRYTTSCRHTPSALPPDSFDLIRFEQRRGVWINDQRAIRAEI